MKNLTDREQCIVIATIRLWNVRVKCSYIPDYELINPSFDLTTEEMRDIRDLVEDIHP